MAYKIAIGTSDGVNVDLKFGEVKSFTIYSVEGKEYSLLEVRDVPEADTSKEAEASDCAPSGCGQPHQGCSGGGGGCGGNSSGCGGPGELTEKIAVIGDCRSVVCKKVGFQAQKQFEKKAISVFDVECTVKEALDKITFYYDKLDNHQSLKVNR